MPSQQRYSSMEISAPANVALKLFESALSSASIELDGWAPTNWNSMGDSKGCSATLELKSINDDGKTARFRMEASPSNDAKESPTEADSTLLQIAYETETEDHQELLVEIFDKTEAVIKTTLTV